PMNAIIGMTELLLDTHLDKSQRELLRIIQDSGDALLSVINDILDFSRIEAGRFELTRLPFDFRESLGDTMRMLAPRADAQGIELAFRVAVDVPHRVIGDPVRFRQVIINLAGNAIKFTEHGEVVVSVDVEQRTATEVTLHISVRDTGIGIPAEKLDIIFEEFQQVDNSSTRSYAGTGLGLAICSRLIALMGGSLTVESQLGTGSVFHARATLTIAEDVTPESTPVDTITDARVLLVDDNDTNLRILTEILASWGMRPVSVNDPQLGLTSLKQAETSGNPFTLLISDFNMPGMNGHQLISTVRADPRFHSLPILVLTSSGGMSTAEQRKGLGIANELLKPVKQSELFDAVIGALNVPNAAERPLRGHVEPVTRVRPLQILLAEDNLANQKLAIGLLSKQGHHVTVAANGQATVDHWASGQFDVILMDVQMPILDGMEATAVIREREQSLQQHIPIIAMTAHAMTGDRERCLEAGMDDYLSKPIRAREIAAKLHLLFGGTEISSAPAAAEPDTPRLPLIDWNDATDLVQGDVELLQSLLDTAREEIPGLLSQIDDAMQAQDFELAASLVHTTKGALLAISALLPADSAARTEAAISTGSFEAARSMLLALNQQFQHLCRAIESRFPAK
ncbi:MAG: response regulator, partial [Planctomycetaceae bacterium]|nr:response regulator [Planctomycetaceae bacterium]